MGPGGLCSGDGVWNKEGIGTPGLLGTIRLLGGSLRRWAGLGAQSSE